MKVVPKTLPQVAAYQPDLGRCSFAPGVRLEHSAAAPLPERIRDAFATMVADLQLAPGPAAIPCRFATLQTTGTPASQPVSETYRLRIAPSQITLEAAHEAGWFYAIQTLRQLIAVHGDEGVPCGTIDDRPRFAWRGSMIDSARHFQPVPWLLRHIDRMAALKLNRLHWHLCDDQGWRPEIRRHPELVTKAAWRGRGDAREGGFYTPAQMREVVDYARQRFITVIPEIEMPGHCNAALVAYPDLSCTGEPLPVADEGWDAFTRNAGRRAFCAGNPRVYTFLEQVLEEINDVFDPPYIHIGGDETPCDHWDQCPKCQRLCRQIGGADSKALRIRFLTRMHDFCRQQLGKPTIAWTDGVSDRLPRDQIVHGWFPGETADAARQGYDVINSTHEWTYLDYPATAEDATRKPDWMIVLPVEKVYRFDPLPTDLEPAHIHHVLGAEAPLWTEHAPDEAEREHQLMPRLAAFAEALWSPPPGQRDYADFVRREKLHRRHGTFSASAEPAQPASVS